MSITTKKGDYGRTSLFGPARVSKDDIRIEACGILDELSSFLGLSRCSITDTKTKKIIEEVQKDLFIIGSEIAAEKTRRSKLKKIINNSQIVKLEKIIDACEKNNKFKNHCFKIPGSNITSGFLDVSRTIARRLERKVVTLKRKKFIINPYLLIYLNRLSDLLYLLARLYEKKFQNRIARVNR